MQKPIKGFKRPTSKGMSQAFSARCHNMPIFGNAALTTMATTAGLSIASLVGGFYLGGKYLPKALEIAPYYDRKWKRLRAKAYAEKH